MAVHKDGEKEELKAGVATESGARPSEKQSPGPADPPAATEEKSLAEQVQKLLAEKEELTNTLVRRQADFENYRKRIEKERHQERHRGAETLVERLLPVLDAFDRALAVHGDPAYEEHRKGFELIRKSLWDVLAKQGLERIESVGKEFNPHLHHAIERVESSDHPDGAVLEEMQTGYVFHGRVLRPAMVRVAVHPKEN